jgi:glyoxylase-like metal-dependent hydrolase (beta-lactamase superfamily II)
MRANRITEHLWRLCRAGVANAYLVREDDGSLTLVDTMFKGSGRAIREAAEPLGGIARLVVTHAHWDHAGAVDELAMERVLAGEVEAPYLRGEAKERMLVRVRTPVVAVAHGERIGSLEVVPAPGHTRGQIALLDTRDRTLLCADAFSTVGRVTTSGRPQLPFPIPALASWDRPTAQRTAAELTRLRPARLAPGHGRVVKDPVEAMEAVTR